MVAILSCDSAENNLCTTSGQRLRCCQRSQWPDMVARSFTAVTQEGEAEGSLGVWRQLRLYSDKYTNKKTKPQQKPRYPETPTVRNWIKKIHSLQSHFLQYLWLIIISWISKTIYIKKYYCVWTHVPWFTYRGQRTTLWNWFSFHLYMGSRHRTQTKQVFHALSHLSSHSVESIYSH